MGNWIPGDPTLVAQILKISAAYSPPPPEGFISPMTWGIEANVVERFGAAGVPKEKITCERDTYTFNFPGTPHEFVDAFKTYYGPTMNALDASLRAMLAHEIAHLRRGDPGWMWLAASLQALFPWQVLFLAVRRRWARLIEFRCDAIAAHHSSPTAVARCLLDVAEWLRPESGTPVIALGMAARASSLRERIEAALKPRRPSRPRRLLAMASSGVSLSALTLVLPGVAATPDVPAPHALAEIVADPPVAATLAAMGAESPAASPSRTAARLLQQEHAELVAQVASLRADLEGRRKSPELEQLVSMLTHRLLVLERLSARLRVRLDRRDIEVDDSPR
jgi:hypothetical protein